MKAMFVGSGPLDRTHECQMFGLVFPRGEPVDVSALLPPQIMKLQANHHFEMVDSEPKKRRGRPRKVAEPSPSSDDWVDDEDDET